MSPGDWHEPSHRAHQSAAQLAREPTPFPVPTTELPLESSFPDWRQRLSRNFARRADGRWEPLTRVHATEGVDADERLRRGMLRLLGLS